MPPLAVPELGVETAADADSDAVRLYVERARAELPDFELTDANANAVARICRALDGLPLAIELAAARVRVLGPEGTAKRLGERLSLLTRSAPDLPERQRSLRATIDWSYRLLDEPAAHVFRALSVFAGGATLEAVEAVADEGTDVPSALDALLDSSLVAHEAPERRAALRDARDDPRVRRRGAPRRGRGGDGPQPPPRPLRRVRRGRELRSREAVTAAAARRDRGRARQHPRGLAEAAGDDDPERQLRLVTSLRFFFNVRGPGAESRRLVAESLSRRARAPRPRQQGRILISAGIHATERRRR